MHVGHSKSQPSPTKISLERWLGTCSISLAFGLTNTASSGRGYGLVTSKSWKIIDNRPMSEIVQDRDIVTIEE